MRSRKPILLVEDDKVDAMTVERAMREISISNELVVKGNGEEALDYLKTCDELPCLIFLDLNMPKMNGLEFLNEIKNDINLKRTPVIVLTTSQDLTDKTESYNLGVSGYINKPVDYERFIEIMRTIDLYWTLSELPPKDLK